MDNTIIEKIKKEIQNFSTDSKTEKIGRVIAVGDGVAEIDGLENAVMSEMVLFDDVEGKSLEEAMKNKDILYGLVLNLEEDVVKVVVLGETSRIKEGMLVKSTGQVLSVPVSDEIIGRVVNTMLEPIDDKGPIKKDKMMPIEREAYGVMDRESVNTPLHTGIKAIDTMVPIGRGQRELIIGDRFTGKTVIALDTIINQKNEPEASRPICIYVAIGQKESKVAQAVAELEKRGAMEYTIIVSASASQPATMQFLAPYAGVAIGEYFMEKGKDVVIIYDDLSKQAVAYRELSLLLRRPPGREAYPGDVFYLHSRLLERSAKLSQELGGGSITALPIIETQEGDVSAYIPTNVISITDGQIALDSNLFNKGLKPAIDVGNSVSRVGSAAQTKAMKKVGGGLRIELAQFRELEAFMQFTQDLDESTKKRINKGERMTALLQQNKHKPLPFERQVVSIYAGMNGLFDEAEVENVPNIEIKWIEFIDGMKPEIFTDIKSSQNLEEKTISKLNQSIKEFKNANSELFTLRKKEN